MRHCPKSNFWAIESFSRRFFLRKISLLPQTAASGAHPAPAEIARTLEGIDLPDDVPFGGMHPFNDGFSRSDPGPGARIVGLDAMNVFARPLHFLA